MMAELSKKDLDILGKLEENARIPLKRIAKSVHLSPEAVAYRIKKLESDGHIVRYHTIVNYFKVGFFKYKLYLRLKAPTPPLVEQICQYFKSNPHCEWVAHMSGRWDIIIGFIVPKPNDFADEIESFMGQFSPHCLEKSITQTLYLAHQPRAGIVHTAGQRIVYHTMLDQPHPIDELDRRILRAIANNARLPVRQLALLVKSTPRQVAYRMAKLEKDQIILAYKAHLDPRVFGKTFHKLILYLRATNKRKREQFNLTCGQLPNVVWPQQVLGAWDYELDLDAAYEDELYGTISKIYSLFPDAILNHEQCAQMKEYKLDLFPGALPAEK